MKTLIESYRSFPGEHCGSVAMRGLLHHYCAIDLPEPVVFGLAAGVDSAFVSGPGIDPSTLLFGRTPTLEVDLGKNMGIDYREQRESDNDHAWEVVREEVLAGRPTMLSGDIFYLDYRDYTVHFPGHRFVLVGFDDETEKAYIGDRIRPEPEACSYEGLRTSRNPPGGMSTHNLWGKFHGTEAEHDLPTAAKNAIAMTCERMLEGADNESFTAGGDFTMLSGVAGAKAFAEDIARWAGRDDARWLASYNARVLEKFGNGGGNFRRLYAGFLDWAHNLDSSLAPAGAAALCTKAADGWTGIANTLFAASEEGADPALFEKAADQTREVAAVERQMFEELS